MVRFIIIHYKTGLEANTEPAVTAKNCSKTCGHRMAAQLRVGILITSCPYTVGPTLPLE